MSQNLTRITTYKLYILLGIILFSIPAFSQVSSNLIALRFEQNSGTRFHYQVSDNQFVNEQNTPAFLIHIFELSRNQTFEATKELVLGTNEHHVRFKHYSNGNRVLASEVVAHYKNGKLTSVNGILYTQNTGNASIDHEAARELAINYSGGKVFNWQSE